MKRALLGILLLAPLAAQGQLASPFSFYIHDTTGTLPDTPLPAAYQVAETPVNGSSPTVLKIINSSQSTVYFITAIMSTTAAGSVADDNFSITGLFDDETLSPGADLLFTVNFTPGVTGPITAFLNVEFQIQQNGCTFTSSVNGCPNGWVNVSTFTGTGSAPQLTLSYQTASGPSVLAPSSSSPLNFPNTSLSSTSTLTFILTNQTAVNATTPAISLPSVDLGVPSAFSLDVSNVPATIAAGQSVTFTVTFAPGQTGYTDGILQIGSNSCVAPVATQPLSNCYPIAGEGIIATSPTNIDALQISYTDATGIRTSPQAATPISFGQLVSGSGASGELTFSLSVNPNASATSVTVGAITVSGAAFSLAALPTLPLTLTQGGATASFQLLFVPPSAGTFTGVLSIGGRNFSLTGGGTSPPFSVSLTLAAPIASDQQATLTVELSPPASGTPLPGPSVLTLMMQFTPSVTGAAANTDSAVAFGAGGSQLTLNLAALPPCTCALAAAHSPCAPSAQPPTCPNPFVTSEDATYNGQPGIAFQTGTTAGTITFSLVYLGSQIYSKDFTINPAPIQITSVQANRESPNLLVTITGYDNTYSASQLSYTFYDTSGNVIGTTFEHDESAAFQQLFFDNNTGGGLFSLQSVFPLVTGAVTQVGSVSVGVANSVDPNPVPTKVTFQ